MTHINIKLYGTNWCSDCKRSKKFLGEQRIHRKHLKGHTARSMEMALVREK